MNAQGDFGLEQEAIDFQRSPGQRTFIHVFVDSRLIWQLFDSERGAPGGQYNPKRSEPPQEAILKRSTIYRAAYQRTRSELSEYRGQIAVAVVVAIIGVVALAAAATFILPGQTTTIAGQQQTTSQSTVQPVGLPPFANQNFDVEVNPAVATVSSQGGTVDAVVTLTATNMTTSQTLDLTTHINIPGYLVKFNTTSVTLQPGGSSEVAISVTVPSGTHGGSYAMSIVVEGGGMQGGTWLVVDVGTGNTAPPP